MNRQPRTAFAAVVLLVVAAAGCAKTSTGTSTGNPADGKVHVPKGVELAISKLPYEDAPALSSGDAQKFAASNRAFAFDLYQDFAKTPGNLFFSPYSISVALAMTQAGANTTTEAENASVMHFDLAEPELHQAFNATAHALAARKSQLADDAKEGDGFQLSIVNQAWGQRGTKFLGDYLDVLAQHYGAGMFLLDFGDSEAARGTINGWVKDETQDRIDELLPNGSLGGDTVLVLTNAIYFKASWWKAFKVEDTKDGTFNTPSGAVTVPMMEQNIETAYGEGPGYKAVALPYLSQDVRMIVIVPDAGMFDATVAKLDDAFFREVHDGMTDSGVQLRMPKFSFESRPPLAMSLMALGMHEAFGPSADLSGFTGSRGLFISNVLHEAFVAVDEKGTEAAAATAVVIGRHTVPEQVQLDVDRPFIFAIYDEPTGQILFLGHVVDPS